MKTKPAIIDLLQTSTLSLAFATLLLPVSAAKGVNEPFFIAVQAPEPSELALFCLGASALLAFRRVKASVDRPTKRLFHSLRVAASSPAITGVFQRCTTTVQTCAKGA